MEFVDLARQQARIADALREGIERVLAGNRYIQGPETVELERRLASLAGAKFCLGCSSGTTALDLILMAWQIGPGDAVLTTPFTFAATAESIARAGAVPVFVDIAPDTLNLDASALPIALEALEKGDPRLHPLPEPALRRRLRPRAVVTVDLFGHPADYAAILPFARAHGLKVLEDAAQGFGAAFRGRPLCGCGCDAAATSFFPTKPLGCYGDGGAVFTDDAALADRIDSLRSHGRADAAHKYDHERLGTNGRLDTIQAAVLLAKLILFPEEVETRRRTAALYGQLLAGDPALILPREPGEEGSRSVWAQYTVRLPAGVDREAVRSRMKRAGVPTAVHYPKGLHEQPAFRPLGYRPDDFPATRDAAARVLSLPMHPYLTENEQRLVAHSLAAALKERRP